MTPDHKQSNEADRAAKAFYGQSDKAFEAQIAEICGNDPKLMQAFSRTRDRFLGRADKPEQRLC
ncbi:MAG: hypothetical protein IKD58_12945 [Loktanella sp.]|nr:hypothetical protein [Loktanella sp.]